MIVADFKIIAFFCLEYQLEHPKNSENTPRKPISSMGFLQNVNWLIFFLLIGCFLIALLLDRAVTDQLTNWPETERAFFATLARLGESDWMLIPTLTVWVFAQVLGLSSLNYTMRWVVRSTGLMSGFIFLSVGLPGMVAAILKVAIGRARPMLMDDVGILHFTPFAGDWRFAGFPSGHATTAFALAWALYFLFGPRVTIVFFGAFLLSLSRIVDNVHYFSDVVAGVTLGTIGAIWVQQQFQKRGGIFRAYKKRQQNRLLLPFKRLRRRFGA